MNDIVEKNEIEKLNSIEEINKLKIVHEEYDGLNINPAHIPKNMEWGWARYTNTNTESLTDINSIDIDNLLDKAKRGWKPVSAAKHPELLTPLRRCYSTGDYIQFAGQLLIEKPKQIQLPYDHATQGMIKILQELKMELGDGVDVVGVIGTGDE
jgi:hypothetical protein